MKVSSVDFALSMVKACRRKPFFRRNRRALLLDIVGSEVSGGSGVEKAVEDSVVKLSTGAKKGRGTGGSRSTVPTNPAPSFKEGSWEVVDGVAVARGIIVGEGVASVWILAFAEE